MERPGLEKLIRRYIDGECNEQENDLIKKWLDNALINDGDKWHSLGSVEKKVHLDKLFQKINSSIQNNEPTSVYPIQRKYPISRKWIAVACLITALFVPVLYYKIFHSEQVIQAIGWKQLVARPGQRMRIKLSDGTLVWLKGGSVIHYPENFVGIVRNIRLNGEAFFEVAKDKAHPFVIETKDLEVKVLGTAFNIQSFETTPNVTVALSEGKLAVNLRDKKLQQPIILSPEEGVSYNRKSGEIKKVNILSYQTKDFFKSGDFNFDNTPLDEVFYILSQSYGLDIQCRGKDYKSRKISGNFSRSQKPDEILESIAVILGGSVSHKGKTLLMSLD